MKSPIKTLSALVIGGFLAGTAIAGPGDAYGAGFASRTLTNNTTPVGIALFRSGTLPGNAANCPMTKENSKLIPNANSKTPGFTKVVTGYSYPGCVGTSAGHDELQGLDNGLRNHAPRELNMPGMGADVKNPLPVRPKC